MLIRKAIPVSKLLERLRSNEKRPIAGDMCPSCKMNGIRIKNIGRLILRNGRKGLFYGCSKYPGCKFTNKFSTAKSFKIGL